MGWSNKNGPRIKTFADRIIIMAKGQMTFDDLPTAYLNSSVEEVDENRLAGHVRRIFGLFKARLFMGFPVSTIDLMEFGGGQYNARLFELRRALIEQGWCIDRDPGKADGGCHYYRLVKLAQSVFYKKRKDKL